MYGMTIQVLYIPPLCLSHNTSRENSCQVFETTGLQRRGNKEASRRGWHVRARIMTPMIEIQRKFAVHFLGVGANKQMGFSEGLQVKILQQLLQHPTFSVLKPKSEKLERLIFSNICHTLSEVKTPHSNNELFLKRATVMACLNGASGVDNQMSGRKVAKALGLHQRNVIAANVRLQHEAEEGSFPLDLCHRQMHRTSIITSEIREIVFQFWLVETRISPNKKDVVRKRIGKSAYVLHPVHLLDLPQVYHSVDGVL